MYPVKKNGEYLRGLQHTKAKIETIQDEVEGLFSGDFVNSNANVVRCGTYISYFSQKPVQRFEHLMAQLQLREHGCELDAHEWSEAWSFPRPEMLVAAIDDAVAELLEDLGDLAQESTRVLFVGSHCPDNCKAAVAAKDSYPRLDFFLGRSPGPVVRRDERPELGP